MDEWNKLHVLVLVELAGHLAIPHGLLLSQNLVRKDLPVIEHRARTTLCDGVVLVHGLGEAQLLQLQFQSDIVERITLGQSCFNIVALKL